MTPTTLRTSLRWSHIGVGVILGVYICSPLHADATATLVARLSLVPVVALTGIAMWKQGVLTRLFRRMSGSRSPSPPSRSARSTTDGGE